MATFHIVMNSIEGEYEAETSGEALDKFAQDAGYKNWLDAVDQGLAGFDQVQITEA